MTDDQFLEMLTKEEGKVKYAYQDSKGLWTIGVGTLIDKRGGGLDDEEIAYLLQRRVDKKIGEVRAALPWVAALDSNRQAVLYAMAYQLGTAGLLGFKNTLALIKAGDYKKAAAGMLNSKWGKTDSPARAKRMAAMMETGNDYSYP
jgi:lysozyme